MQGQMPQMPSPWLGMQAQPTPEQAMQMQQTQAQQMQAMQAQAQQQAQQNPQMLASNYNPSPNMQQAAESTRDAFNYKAPAPSPAPIEKKEYVDPYSNLVNVGSGMGRLKPKGGARPIKPKRGE